MAGLAKHLEEARDRIAALEQEVQALKHGKDINEPLIIHRNMKDPNVGIPQPAKPKLAPQDDPNSPDWVPF